MCVCDRERAEAERSLLVREYKEKDASPDNNRAWRYTKRHVAARAQQAPAGRACEHDDRTRRSTRFKKSPRLHRWQAREKCVRVDAVQRHPQSGLSAEREQRDSQREREKS